MRVKDALAALGIDPDIPLIGYSFGQTWAAQQRETLRGRFRAAEQARHRLRDSFEEWGTLRPLMAAPDEATFIALREGYRAGIPRRSGAPERAAAGQLWGILSSTSRRWWSSS